MRLTLYLWLHDFFSPLRSCTHQGAMCLGELMQKSGVPVPVPAPATMTSTVPSVFLNQAVQLKTQSEVRRLPPRKPLFSKCARDRTSSKECSRAMKSESRFLEVGNGRYYVHRLSDPLNKVGEPGPMFDAMKLDFDDGVRQFTEVRKHGKTPHIKNNQNPRLPCKPEQGSLSIQKVGGDKGQPNAVKSCVTQSKCLRGIEMLRKPCDVSKPSSKHSSKDYDDGWPTLNPKITDAVLPSLISPRKKSGSVRDQDSQKSSEKDAETELRETTDDTARQGMTSLALDSPTGSSCSSTASFHYSNYRYDAQHPPEELGRHVRALDAYSGFSKERSHVSNATNADVSAQVQMMSPVAPWKAPSLIGPTSKALPPKTMPEELEQMGQVLCRVYGARMEDLVWSYNTISIPFECKTTQQNPDSPRPGEPTLWLRGGRVYDYIGDLGTYTEFIDQANPWKTNRNHRRNLGYQPFPFLPQPPGERSEDGVNLRYQDELKKWTQTKLL